MSKHVFNDLIKIFKSGISAVLPENLIRNSLRYNAATQRLSVLNDDYDLSQKNVYVIGTGKAVQRMAIETEKTLGTKIKKGIVSIPVNSLQNHYVSNLIYLEGAENNLPDHNAESTAKKILELASSIGKDDCLLVLISGGGSALLPLPKNPITLLEKTDLIKQLANSGADITELNVVRKKISSVKGGKLALAAEPALVISLILSDIVGDPLDLIASGPTVANKEAFGKAKEIVQKYLNWDDLPESIKILLDEKDERQNWPANINNYLIGSNKLTIEEAVEEIKNLKYTPLVLSHTVTGNVTDIATEYFKITSVVCDLLSGRNQENIMADEIIVQLDQNALKEAQNSNTNGIILVFGGETTVKVKGEGKGGRNQHLALEYSRILNDNKNKFNNFEVYILSAGTDGIDGPTDAAGAIGYKELVDDAAKEDLDIDKYLKNCDSYNFYKSFRNGNCHVITGHTGTNVMDLQLILIQRKKEKV